VSRSIFVIAARFSESRLPIAHPNTPIAKQREAAEPLPPAGGFIS
jgi:hypothetical protein